jgi:hypothetical protein
MLAADLAGGKKMSKAELDRQQREHLAYTMERVAYALHKFAGEDPDFFPVAPELKEEPTDKQMRNAEVQAELAPEVCQSVTHMAALIEGQVVKMMAVVPA